MMFRLLNSGIILNIGRDWLFWQLPSYEFTQMNIHIVAHDFQFAK